MRLPLLSLRFFKLRMATVGKTEMTAIRKNYLEMRTRYFGGDSSPKGTYFTNSYKEYDRIISSQSNNTVLKYSTICIYWSSKYCTDTMKSKSSVHTTP